MKSPLPTLENIAIATPCSASWVEMAGDERTRFCGQCSKHVYNLSAMTADEANHLIKETEGQICVRFYRRADGTIRTSDCPVGRRSRLYRRIRLAGLASTVSGFLVYGAHEIAQPTMGKWCVGEALPDENGSELEVLPPPREVLEPVAGS